ncbi:MAG: serine/threonine protein kinase [Pseudomonadota bacterium]
MSEALSPNLRLIGRYAILRELRRDRSSVSYVAADPVMHREVVLKAVQMPPPADGKGSTEAEISALEAAFVRQAQAAGKLHHPHIVTVFDAGRIHNVGYLAIERVAGRPLHELLASGWRPEFVHAASIAARIADAIDYAHGQGIAHGHLGPQHVILQSGGAPKVEGFGGWIDGGTGGEDALARTERLLPYFQNELAEETRRADVRAIAALLYMMLTGRAPRGDKPAPVATLRTDTPPALAKIVDETLDPNAPASHRAAGDLRDALTAFLWIERKEHVAPGTIGIPLTAPPREALIRDEAEPATVPRTIPQPFATAQLPAEPPPAEETSAGSFAQRVRALAQRVRSDALPWLRANRLLVGAMAALLLAGLAIGMILGNVAGDGAKGATAASKAAPASAGPVQPGTGVIVLDIAPWGEVFVDNKPVGVTPPLAELKLPAGRHTIEIRHGDRPAIVAHVDVDPSKPQQIRHRFE